MESQIVENGIVVNAIAINPGTTVSDDGLRLIFPDGEGERIADDGTKFVLQPGAGIGWTESDGVLVAPRVPIPGPAPVPASVSRAQFFHAAALGDIITKAEAVAVFRGELPTSLSGAIATLSAADQFAAEIAILGNATFERANPLLVTIGAAMGKTPDQLDALFILAATL